MPITLQAGGLCHWHWLHNSRLFQFLAIHDLEYVLIFGEKSRTIISNGTWIFMRYIHVESECAITLRQQERQKYNQINLISLIIWITSASARKLMLSGIVMSRNSQARKPSRSIVLKPLFSHSLINGCFKWYILYIMGNMLPSGCVGWALLIYRYRSSIGVADGLVTISCQGICNCHTEFRIQVGTVIRNARCELNFLSTTTLTSLNIIFLSVK